MSPDLPVLRAKVWLARLATHSLVPKPLLIYCKACQCYYAGLALFPALNLAILLQVGLASLALLLVWSQ